MNPRAAASRQPVSILPGQLSHHEPRVESARIEAGVGRRPGQRRGGARVAAHASPGERKLEPHRQALARPP
jgi:hypothetical protein